MTSWVWTATCIRAARSRTGVTSSGFLRSARTREDITASDLDGIEAVVHLAALSNDPLGDLQPGLTDDIITSQACVSRNWPRALASAASCLHRPAAITARPGIR